MLTIEEVDDFIIVIFFKFNGIHFSVFGQSCITSLSI